MTAPTALPALHARGTDLGGRVRLDVFADAPDAKTGRVLLGTLTAEGDAPACAALLAALDAAGVAVHWDAKLAKKRHTAALDAVPVAPGSPAEQLDDAARVAGAA